jgi:SAM-dependent methyltransferase
MTVGEMSQALSECGGHSTPPQPGTLFFQCNICGELCTAELDLLAREVKSCSRCSSSPRTRALIRALSTGLFQQNLIICEFPDRKDLKGLGFTDTESYARRLAQKFDYVNTYFHQEPRLDIASDDIAPDHRETYDFIISSEVFEHVIPPIQAAFEHVHQMLKPGALFVLTVPYGHQPDIIEHFPELYEFSIVQQDGVFELHNITRSGSCQTFRDLVFHGGRGSTLEMRVFSFSGLLQLLHAAGFESVTVHSTPDFRHGIWWPQPWSLPITAKKRRA